MSDTTDELTYQQLRDMSSTPRVDEREAAGGAYMNDLARTLERENNELRTQAAVATRVLAGLPNGAIDGGWTAAGLSAYAAGLERENATLTAEVERKQAHVRALQSAGYELTSRLCTIVVDTEKDGHELIRRESAMDFIVKWRMTIDKANDAARRAVLPLSTEEKI